jgi:tRNA dimethylallyltransferase
MALTRFKTAILIVGPTAVGKTSVAIELAKRFNTEIISADSRQCFKELNIGVARPSEQELQAVRHYFSASHSIHDNVNAGTFEQYALQKANELFHTHDRIIVTGGTGLYVKAFCEGLDEIPNVPNETRKEIISKYEKNGLEWLQEQIQKKDPRFYTSGEIRNPHRLMRALEVAEATGRSILEFRNGQKETRDFNIVKIGLELPKEELRRNINTRVDSMIDAGLVEETKQLSPSRNLNALQTVGYTEIFDYLDGKVPLEQATELIKQNTRQYAKRQMTWFKKDKEIKWFSPSEISRIEEYLVIATDATNRHR